MPDRIEELFEELAEDYITFPGGRQIRTQEKLMGDIYSSLAGFGDELTQQGRIGREYEDIEKERLVEGLYKNDPAVLAGFATAATIPVSAPAWLSAFTARAASQIPGLNKLYGQVGQDFTKYIEPVKSKLSGIFGRSGSRVDTDMVGRVPLPKVKDPVVTKRGPRGFTNIESPMGPPRPAPPKGTRNTGGISATERAQLPTIRAPSSHSPRGPYSHLYYPLEAKNVPEALTKASLNRGRPYPGPHLTAEEGLKKLVPLRLQGKVKEATWYQHPRTGELYQYHYGTGALARGFYKRGKDAVGTPQHARKAAEEFNPNIIGARTSVREGGITATKAARETQVEIKKLERWKRSHEAKVRRGDDQYQEGMRSGYEPDIKGGGKMKDNSMKRIQEIQAELDELYKKL